MIPIARPILGEEERQAVIEVLDSGMLAQGARVQRFEEAFAELCGTAYAVAVSSGSTALYLALLAHGVGPGDEVITTPFSFIATANAVLYTGARPVFVDIDPVTYNLAPELAAAAITPRTKALLPVHLFGLASDLQPLLEIAEAHGLALIEDSCQAHGATYRGRPTGSFGTGCFSFYPTKNMTAAEGGMITADDAAIADRCRLLRNHGMRRRYYHEQLGFNYRMSDLHAAIGLAQIGKLTEFNRRRIANAGYLSQRLRGVSTPQVPVDRRHVFNQYTVRVPGGRRDALAEHLAAHGVGTAIYYPIPIHQQACYRDDLGYDDHLPQSEAAAEEVLSLPVHPGLAPEDLDRVVELVNGLGL